MMSRDSSIKNRVGKVNYKQVNRYMAREGKKYGDKMQPVPREEWPDNERTRSIKTKPIALWRSNKFMAQVVEEPNGAIRISINRTQINPDYHFIDGISWDDIQRIKNEIGYADKDCIELYPADCDVINVANIRHLFVLPEQSFYNWNKGD